MSDDAVGFCRV